MISTFLPANISSPTAKAKLVPEASIETSPWVAIKFFVAEDIAFLKIILPLSLNTSNLLDTFTIPLNVTFEGTAFASDNTGFEWSK